MEFGPCQRVSSDEPDTPYQGKITDPLFGAK